jgi:hypothetical protein
LVMHSSTLMKNRILEIITDVRTDMAGECPSVRMVKECRKHRHAFDSKGISFRRTIIPNDWVLPSVEVFVVAEPSPYLVESPTTGFACGGSVPIALFTCR